MLKASKCGFPLVGPVEWVIVLCSSLVGSSDWCKPARLWPLSFQSALSPVIIQTANSTCCVLWQKSLRQQHKQFCAFRLFRFNPFTFRSWQTFSPLNDLFLSQRESPLSSCDRSVPSPVYLKPCQPHKLIYLPLRLNLKVKKASSLSWSDLFF